MNRCDDCAEPLFATDSCKYIRSHAYGRLSKDLLRAKEQARARQHSCIMRVNIAGNEYCLVVWVNDAYRMVYIRFIGTHAWRSKSDRFPSSESALTRYANLAKFSCFLRCVRCCKSISMKLKQIYPD